MAGDFNKALGNSMMRKVAQKSSRDTNIPKIENIDINLLDENPDNEQIFNMDDIQLLMRSIKDNGFTGAVEVFKKPDGRYEISSGHRRVRAMKELGRTSVPCLVNSMPDDIVRAKKLLDSNITNRDLKPLDYARSIEYYIDYVLKPSGFKGQIDKKCAEYFGISSSSVYKYRALLKLVPQLQNIADSDEMPYSAFSSAHRLSPEKQETLAKDLDKKISANKKEEITRKYIEDKVRDLLKEEDNYREANNKEIAEKSSKKKDPVKKASADINKALDILEKQANSDYSSEKIKSFLSVIKTRVDKILNTL